MDASFFEDAEEDEASAEGCVEDAEEDERWDHEAEGYLFIDISQRAEGWGRVILVSDVGVDDSSDAGEEDHFCDGDGVDGFWKVSRFAHFRYE